MLYIGQNLLNKYSNFVILVRILVGYLKIAFVSGLRAYVEV
jgi:hypothetical protein